MSSIKSHPTHHFQNFIMSRLPRASPTHLPPNEAALARRLQEAVSDCTLSTPSALRERVIYALAAMQTNPGDLSRISRGELTPSERRVVRTVTNRGASVRSRIRKKGELSRLRAELKAKEERVQLLESELRNAASGGLFTSTSSSGASTRARGNSSRARSSSGLRQNPERERRGSDERPELLSFIDEILKKGT